MNDNFVWVPKLPDNFPSKNMETYGYILPDETDIDWYNPDANPKEFTITTAAQLRGVSWLTNNVSNLDFKDWTLRLGEMAAVERDYRRTEYVGADRELPESF